MIQHKTAKRYAEKLKKHFLHELLKMCEFCTHLKNSHCFHPVKACDKYYSHMRKIQQLDAIIQDLGGKKDV